MYAAREISDVVTLTRGFSQSIPVFFLLKSYQWRKRVRQLSALLFRVKTLGKKFSFSPFKTNELQWSKKESTFWTTPYVSSVYEAATSLERAKAKQQRQQQIAREVWTQEKWCCILMLFYKWVTHTIFSHFLNIYFLAAFFFSIIIAKANNTILFKKRNKINASLKCGLLQTNHFSDFKTMIHRCDENGVKDLKEWFCTHSPACKCTFHCFTFFDESIMTMILARSARALSFFHCFWRNRHHNGPCTLHTFISYCFKVLT